MMITLQHRHLPAMGMDTTAFYFLVTGGLMLATMAIVYLSSSGVLRF